MRIVSLAPSNTEILYALGCGDMIVADTRYCDYPEDAKKKKKIGGWLDINEEVVKQLRPDAVMTSTFVQDEVVAQCKKAGLKVFHVDPKILEHVFQSIMSIGEFVNHKSRALKLVNEMRSEFLKIRGAVSNRKPVKVYCEEWYEKEQSHASGNWVPKIIEIAGGKSLCREGEESHVVSIAKIEEFDPDCIVLSICGRGNKVNKDFVTKRKDWNHLRAVQEGKIFVIDDSLLNRPGPRLVEGAKELARIFEQVAK